MTDPIAGERIPVSLVTGFLGSGKTTLIRGLLTQPAMAGTAVIVNEFGAVGLDDAIFAEALDDDNVVLLANGCLCCVAGDDLAEAVWRLTRRALDRPRRIVVETSGLADPAPSLRRMMADPRLRRSVRLDGLIAIVDAVDGPRNLDTQPIAARQCAAADRRVITKSDLAETVAAKRLAERLKMMNPGAPVLFATNGAIEAAALFGAGLFDPNTGRADPDNWLGLEDHRAAPASLDERAIHLHDDAVHDQSVGSWLIEVLHPVDWACLSPRIGDVIARYGDRLLRLKGLVWTAGDDRPLVIHGVQRVFHTPVRLASWSRPPATSLVVIGDAGCRAAVDRISDALADTKVGTPIEAESAPVSA